MDSYDKLKPYGFGINDCIDGYSHHMVWLKVCYTNSNPMVIAGYFLKVVLDLGGSPRKMRIDPGTENVHVKPYNSSLLMKKDVFLLVPVYSILELIIYGANYASNSQNSLCHYSKIRLKMDPSHTKSYGYQYCFLPTLLKEVEKLQSSRPYQNRRRFLSTILKEAGRAARFFEVSTP